jgi:hypothetical protein
VRKRKWALLNSNQEQQGGKAVDWLEQVSDEQYQV